jgi:hypothetical protein
MQPDRFILETRDTHGPRKGLWVVMEDCTEDADLGETIRVSREICGCDDTDIRITKLDGELGTFRDVTEDFLSAYPARVAS